MLETMSTTVRDASLTTARRRQIALYGYSVANGNLALPGPEQAPSYGNKGTGPSADVVTGITVGGFLVGQSSATCVCDSSVTLAGYAKTNAVTNGRNNA
jgi:hypothetical protein